MNEWRRERTDKRVDSYYGPTLLAWLKSEASKDPNGLARPGTIVRVLVERAFERAHRAKKVTQ
jgi:hypothetical protein